MILFSRLLARFGPLAVLAMVCIGCSDNAGDSLKKASLNREDLDEASLKIVAGEGEKAVVMLKKLNRDFPENTEVMELLGLALSESGNYMEAAFWNEQVASLHPNGAPFLKLAGECYELAGEDNSAILTYSDYVAQNPDDGLVWHKLYQLRARAARVPGLPKNELNQLAKDAINAINMAKVAITPQEGLEIARLLLKINILPVAESYFEEVSTNPEGDQRAALLGLLEVHLAQRTGDKAESTARLLNQRFAGAIDDSPLAAEVLQLLGKRHASTFFALEYDFEGRSVRDLFTTLQEATTTTTPQPGKLPSGNNPPDELNPDPPEPEDPISLAELFGLDDSQDPDSEPSENPNALIDKTADFLERAELAMLDKNYRGAQLFLKEAIKKEPDNVTAWFLRSRAHLLASELEAFENTADNAVQLALQDNNHNAAELFLKEIIKEAPDNATAWFLRSRTHLLKDENDKAEMYATEAVRLAPESIEIRLHYLEAARLVLTARHFLRELEKAQDQFPRSLDIIWQLAQQYHVEETNNNAAAILYRRFLETAPPDHPMREKVQRELASIGNL